MSEQTDEKAATTSLKSIYLSLQEVYTILQIPQDTLEYALNGNASPVEGPKSGGDIGTVTMEMINNKIHSISRRSSDISKMISKLVGS